MLLLNIVAAFSLLPCAVKAAEVGSSGTLSSLDGGLGGTVKVVDKTTLMISGYKLKDASAPALYWWGSTSDDLSSGFRINNEQVTKPPVVREAQRQLWSGHSVQGRPNGAGF